MLRKLRLERRHQEIQFDSDLEEPIWCLYSLIIQQIGQHIQSILVFEHIFPTGNLAGGEKFLRLRDCGIHVWCKKTDLLLKRSLIIIRLRNHIYMRCRRERKCSIFVWPWKGPLVLRKWNSPEKGCWVETSLCQTKEISLIRVENQSWSQSTSM